MPTHEVTNQVVKLIDYNIYRTDAALQGAIMNSDAAWIDADLRRFGATLG